MAIKQQVSPKASNQENLLTTKAAGLSQLGPIGRLANSLHSK